MPIKDFEYYHGVILVKVMKEPEKITTLRLLEKNSTEEWAVYRVNDKIILFTKYSTSPETSKKDPNRYSWKFRFNDKELNKMKSLLNEGEFFLALVCSQKEKGNEPAEICLMDAKEVSNCITIDTEYPQHISVAYLPGKSLRVLGSKAKKEIVIARNRLDTLQIPG